MHQFSGSVKAAWVVPVQSPPIRNGVIGIKDGIIVSIEPQIHHSPDVIDLGPTILLPCLVNAHTHLEFSHLPQPLGTAGMRLTDWIPMVVNCRKESAQSDEANLSKSEAVKLGISQSIRHGVGCIGEIATLPTDPHPYRSSKFFRSTVFLEVLGHRDDEMATTLHKVKTTLQQFPAASMRAGISPHAPYSISPSLFREIVAIANSNDLPVAMHLAESQAERQLLSEGDGPFVPMLQELGAWEPSHFQHGTRPLNFLKVLAELPRSLVIHGNYLDGEELEFIAHHQPQMSVVYCPRTHEFFQHSPYPLLPMLELGINVAIGTDSRASNPDLNVLAELRHVRSRFPQVKPEKIVEMGTLNGAKALGIARSMGSLGVGKDACFTVIHCGDEVVDDPIEGILQAEHATIFTPQL